MIFKKRVLSLFALLAIVAMPLVSHAATFAGDDEYSLRSDEVVDGNAYIGGGIVLVEGGVDGDLFVGGGDVTMSGSVAEDLVMGGGDLVVSGDVTEDVRIAGGNLSISGYIGGELVAAGGYVHITSGAVIDGDVLVTGGRLLIEGTVNGNIEAYGGEVEFGGVVEGSTTSQSDIIVISKTAVLNGGLTYKSILQADIAESAQISGGIVYESLGEGVVSANTNVAALVAVATAFFSALWFLIALITLLTALALYFVAKSQMKVAVRHTFKKFWPETVRGFVLVLLLPAAIGICFMSVVGAGLGLLGIALVGLFALLAKVGASILTGSLVFRLVTKKFEVNWKTILVGVITLHFIKLIPFVGGLFFAIMFLAAFGTLWLTLYKTFTKK